MIDFSVLLDLNPCRDCLSTRIILVDDRSDDHIQSKQGSDDEHASSEATMARSKRDPTLLGLVAEQVSELTHARPDQVLPPPVSLPQTPYLGAIIQTDQGIIQLIDVEKVRDTTLRLSDSGQDRGAQVEIRNRIGHRLNLE